MQQLYNLFNNKVIIMTGIITKFEQDGPQN